MIGRRNMGTSDVNHAEFTSKEGW